MYYIISRDDDDDDSECPFIISDDPSTSRLPRPRFESRAGDSPSLRFAITTFSSARPRKRTPYTHTHTHGIVLFLFGLREEMFYATILHYCVLRTISRVFRFSSFFFLREHHDKRSLRLFRLVREIDLCTYVYTHTHIYIDKKI